MFKPIFNNPHLEINLDGEYRSTKTKTIFVTKDKSISIKLPYVTPNKIEHKNVVCTLRRLAYLSHHEIDITTDIRAIEFVELPDGNVEMIHMFPLYSRPGFRVIPNYHRYSVDVEGNLLDSKTNRISRPNIPGNQFNKHYPTYYSIYDPIKNGFRSVLTHRIIAYAWVKNNDWKLNNIVNHKDANKNNFHIDNLEWVTQSYNCIHAVESGLTTGVMTCRTRNYLTGEIIKHRSVRSLREFLNHPSIDMEKITNCRNGYLFADKFEIKLDNDTSEWFYVDNKKPGILGRYDITISKGNEILHKFTDTLSFYDKYEISEGKGLMYVVNTAFNKQYPELSISVTDHHVTGPYYILDVTNMNIVKIKTTVEIAKFIGVSNTTVKRQIHSKSIYLIGDKYIVKSDKEELRHLKNRSFTKELTKKFYEVVTRTSVDTFKSLREIAKFLKRDRKFVMRIIRDGEEYNGYTVYERTEPLAPNIEIY